MPEDDGEWGSNHHDRPEQHLRPRLAENTVGGGLQSPAEPLHIRRGAGQHPVAGQPHHLVEGGAEARSGLVGASAQGLEVKSRKGEWVPFTADADTIVVNIGDMLQRLTNHVYPSTTHRVVNPPGEEARKPRYSVPFFLHPNPDFLIDVLPSCISADNPSRYPEPITAHGFLEERLREIKLK